MTVEEVQSLLAQGEGQRIEFKEEAIKPGDLAETLVAFANAQGGIVVLGVGDDGKPVGLRDQNLARDLVLTAASRELCDPPVRLASLDSISVQEGIQVLVAEVPRSRRLHATHGRFLARRGSRNVALSTAEVLGGTNHLETGGLMPLPLLAGYQSLYEVLRYDATLRLLDPRGHEAVLEREEDIRFLQSGVVGIYDRAWGEGQLFADYQVEPGVVADRFQVGSQHIVLISLREIKNRGEVLHLRVRRRVVGGWTRAEEWLETAVNHRTKLLRMAVVFPVERPPRQASVAEQGSRGLAQLDRRHWSVDVEGRWVVTWRKRHPVLGETYVLRWTW